MKSNSKEKRKMAKKYYEADREAILKKRAEIGSGKFWKPRDGKNQIRILPPYSEKGLWFFELALHYGFTDEEERKRAYPCMKQWKDEPCPACDAMAIIKKQDGGKKVADKMFPRSKYYVNLIDRRIGEDKVFIWGISGKMLNEIMSYEDDEDYGNITHPKKGFDFVIEKSGQGLQTKYQIRIKPKSTPAGDFPDLFDLEEEVPNEITGREMAEMLLEQYSEFLEDELDPSEYKGGKKKKKDDDEDEDEEPKRKKRKKRSDDDEDEEEEKPKKKRKKEEDEEDEDEEPPKKKRKKVEDDEDDEEEEAPRKKKKRAIKDEEDDD